MVKIDRALNSWTCFACYPIGLSWTYLLFFILSTSLPYEIKNLRSSPAWLLLGSHPIYQCLCDWTPTKLANKSYISRIAPTDHALAVNQKQIVMRPAWIRCDSQKRQATVGPSEHVREKRNILIKKKITPQNENMKKWFVGCEPRTTAEPCCWVGNAYLPCSACHFEYSAHH